MASRLVVVSLRWGIAAIGAAALLDAVVVAQTSSGFVATADFLSSVTALTNILSVVVFVITGADAWRRAWRPVHDPALRRRRTASSPDIRGKRAPRIAVLRAVNVATLLSMSVLFLSIYGPVVAADPAQLNLTSALLHVVIPALAVVDWFGFPPERRVDMRGVLLVLIFPAIWFVYTFIRGALTGRYVYEFLDPAGPEGMQGVIAMTVLIIASFFLIGVVVFVTQRSRKRTSATLI